MVTDLNTTVIPTPRPGPTCEHTTRPTPKEQVEILLADPTAIIPRARCVQPSAGLLQTPCARIILELCEVHRDQVIRELDCLEVEWAWYSNRIGDPLPIASVPMVPHRG